MRVAVVFDGHNAARVILYWDDYRDDTDPEDRERMRRKGLFGYVDHEWQKIKWVAPNTLFIEDSSRGYTYDVTFTFEEATGPA